jgi:hypothetical protein
MRSTLRILPSALTGLLLTTLLSAFARFLLLLARLRLTWATLLTALLATLVLLASALILIHILSSIAGDPAQSNASDANSFATARLTLRHSGPRYAPASAC